MLTTFVLAAAVAMPTRIFAGGAVGVGGISVPGDDGHFSSGGTCVGALAGGTYAVHRYIDLGAGVDWALFLKRGEGREPNVQAIAPRASLAFVINRDDRIAVVPGIGIGAFFAFQNLVGWRRGATPTYPPPETYTATYSGYSLSIFLEVRARVAEQFELVPAIELATGSGSGAVRTDSFEPYLGSYLNGSLGMVTVGLRCVAAARF